MGLFRLIYFCFPCLLDYLKSKLQTKSRPPIPEFSGYHYRKEYFCLNDLNARCFFNVLSYGPKRKDKNVFIEKYTIISYYWLSIKLTLTNISICLLACSFHNSILETLNIGMFVSQQYPRNLVYWHVRFTTVS